MKHELDRLKSFGSSDVSKDARKLREKLLDMEEKLKRQEEELQEEVTQHEATKRKLDRVGGHNTRAAYDSLNRATYSFTEEVLFRRRRTVWRLIRTARS